MHVFLWTLEWSGLGIALLGLAMERCARVRRR